MSEEFQISYKFLKAIAKSSEKFITFCNKLYNDPRILDVKREVDCRFYERIENLPSGRELDFQEFVEISLHKEIHICWNLEIYPYQNYWNIDSCIIKTEEGLQEIVKELPLRTAETITQLDIAISEMIELLLADYEIYLNK